MVDFYKAAEIFKAFSVWFHDRRPKYDGSNNEESYLRHEMYAAYRAGVKQGIKLGGRKF